MDKRPTSFAVALLFVASLCACAHRIEAPNAAPSSPRPLEVQAPSQVAPTPIPLPVPVSLPLTVQHHLQRYCPYEPVGMLFRGYYYAGCGDYGDAFLLSRNGRLLLHKRLDVPHIQAIIPLDSERLAFLGFGSGATLHNFVQLVRADSLEPFSQAFADTTLLGVWNRRAYFDDWCCNGRPDEYRPATLFSVSLAKEGPPSSSVDFAPEPQLHPASQQPLGQGEWNYLIGPYFYVVVDVMTYRYDVRDLNAGFLRLATPRSTGTTARPSP